MRDADEFGIDLLRDALGEVGWNQLLMREELDVFLHVDIQLI